MLAYQGKYTGTNYYPKWIQYKLCGTQEEYLEKNYAKWMQYKLCKMNTNIA